MTKIISQEAIEIHMTFSNQQQTSNIVFVKFKFDLPSNLLFFFRQSQYLDMFSFSDDIQDLGNLEGALNQTLDTTRPTMDYNPRQDPQLMRLHQLYFNNYRKAKDLLEKFEVKNLTPILIEKVIQKKQCMKIMEAINQAYIKILNLKWQRNQIFPQLVQAYKKLRKLDSSLAMDKAHLKKTHENFHETELYFLSRLNKIRVKIQQSIMEDQFPTLIEMIQQKNRFSQQNQRNQQRYTYNTIYERPQQEEQSGRQLVRNSGFESVTPKNKSRLKTNNEEMLVPKKFERVTIFNPFFEYEITKDQKGANSTIIYSTSFQISFKTKQYQFQLKAAPQGIKIDLCHQNSRKQIRKQIIEHKIQFKRLQLRYQPVKSLFIDGKGINQQNFNLMKLEDKYSHKGSTYEIRSQKMEISGQSKNLFSLHMSKWSPKENFIKTVEGSCISGEGFKKGLLFSWAVSKSTKGSLKKIESFMTKLMIFK